MNIIIDTLGDRGFGRETITSICEDLLSRVGAADGDSKARVFMVDIPEDNKVTTKAEMDRLIRQLRLQGLLDPVVKDSDGKPVSVDEAVDEVWRRLAEGGGDDE